MKKIMIFAALLGLSYVGHAQVGIGTTKPHKAAILDIDGSGRKGVIMPKVKLEGLTIPLPEMDGVEAKAQATGMLVYNTNVNSTAKLEEGFYMWSGLAWTKLSSTEDLKKIAKEEIEGEGSFIKNLKDSFFNYTVDKNGKVQGGTSSLFYDFENNVFYTVELDEKGNIKKVKTDITKGIRASESKTSIKKGVVTTDKTKPATVDVLTLDETKLKKGQIFYEYLAEDDATGKPVVHYIDVTSDVYNTINNNDDIKNIINETVTSYLTKGGNVYFGDHDKNATTKDVLYYVDDNKQNKTIDIGETIKEFFTNSKEETIREIREGMGYNITTEVVSTGNKLNGKTILTYTAAVDILENDAQTGGISLPLKYQGKSIEVFDIKLINPTGQVERAGVTEVKVTGSKIDFALGSGLFYVTLPKGTYKAVVEFVEK